MIARLVKHQLGARRAKLGGYLYILVAMGGGPSGEDRSTAKSSVTLNGRLASRGETSRSAYLLWLNFQILTRRISVEVSFPPLSIAQYVHLCLASCFVAFCGHLSARLVQPGRALPIAFSSSQPSC